MSKGKGYRYYQCPRCGHAVCSTHRPYSIHWNNGHVCIFVEKTRPSQKEGTPTKQAEATGNAPCTKNREKPT
jgi:uncharacterized C2H2 Zn-finger protein